MAKLKSRPSIEFQLAGSATINGDRTGATWGSSTGGWNDNTRNAYPDTLEVTFSNSKKIDEIDVVTLQNNWTTAGQPTLSSAATGEGILDFIVQYCSANCSIAPTWTTITGGNVTGNDKAWRQFTFPAVTTTKIRVVVNNARNNWSRIVELEAYLEGGSSAVHWLVTDQLGTPRMTIDQTGALANVKRHDYLPFGEELVAGTGGRTTGQGYTADSVRQKFTQKERDNETGLDYFGARYYGSTQGRFTSVDPGNWQAMQDLAQPQSWNAYSYVNNNPLARTDPDGRGIGSLFQKIKNKLWYGVWEDNDALRADEASRRQQLLELQSTEPDGVLRVDNGYGQYIILHPETMGRSHVFWWTNRIYDIWSEGGGRHELTPEQLASAIDSAGYGAMLAAKPVNLPSSRKITVDMDHIGSGHIEGGSRLTQSRAAGGAKEVFPTNMSRGEVEKAIREAYSNSRKLQTQGSRVLVQGQGGGQTIQMWVNTTTKTIESAWPIH